MTQNKTKARARLLLLPLALLLAAALLLVVTRPLAHLHGTFSPAYPRQNLTPLLEQDALSRADYKTIFFQTGLGSAAVDGYLAMGQPGIQRILDTQDAFFSTGSTACAPLAITTWEDHRVDAGGQVVSGFPMAPLEEGDVLLSFSTHTLGWRHGHAGLVVDAEAGLTLEAVVIGSDSAIVNAGHWASYTTYLHLRLRDLSEEDRNAIRRFAFSRLDGIPYHLTSGIFSPEKLQDPDSAGLGAQCAYLAWYALAWAGYDTDADGGRIVTVGDLSESPLFEVVQVYGLDPADYLDRALPADC